MKKPFDTNQKLLEEISALKQRIREMKESAADHIKAEEELRKSCRFLSDLIEHSGNIICIKDRQGRYELVNRKWEEVMGLKRDDAIGRTSGELFPGPSSKQFQQNDKEVIEAGLVLEKEATLEDERGKRFFIATKFPLRNEDGIIRHIGVIVTDITARKQAEQELRKSETLYRTFINATSDMVFLKDEQLRNIVVNQPLAAFFGKREEDIIGKSDLELMPPDAAEKCRQTDIEALTSKSVVISEEIVGNEAFETLKFPVNLRGGKTGVGGFIRNITERKRVEEELHESRRSLEDIIEFLPDATFVIDKDGKIIAWNRAIEAMTGVRKEKMLGKGDYEYALPFYGKRRPILIDYVLNPDKREATPYPNMQQAGDIVSAEDVISNMPLGDIHLYAAASVLRDSRGNVIAAIECLRDDTERRKLAARLNRAEKMEALGTLAGGVAHDLNNVLGVLAGYSELLVGMMPAGSTPRKYAENIQRSSVKGAAIIQDLLTMARRGVAVSEVVNLNKIVSDYLRTPEFENLKSLNPRIKILTEVENGLLNIKGSPIHLSKTIMNLVSNAAEAIADRGQITIKTENRYLDYIIKGYDEMKEGDYVLLTVSDTGSGISTQDLGKIFEPFYTKKVMGRSGTGLGLAVVWGTVKDHNGYIDVQSKEGQGTTFTIYLPVTREEMGKVAKTVSPVAYMGKGQSILVVDDVQEQRELAKSMLEMLGYQVETVASGEEAVEYLKSRQAGLIILDMIMDPGIDGMETYRRILEINPGQKAIIVSGFSETERVRKTQEMGAGAFIRKPYVLEKIGLAIKHELDRK